MSSLFCDIAHRRLVVTDVSGQPILDCLTWKMRPTDGTKKSATTYQSKLCNILEERRSHLRSGRSLKSGIESQITLHLYTLFVHRIRTACCCLK
jgi:hypothetical protein